MSEPSMGNVSRIGVLTIWLIGASPLAAEPFGVATVPAAPDSRISAIWRDLQARYDGANTFRAAVEVIRTHELCGVTLFGWSDRSRLALAEHLSRVAVRHTAMVFTSHPTYRGLLDDLT